MKERQLPLVEHYIGEGKFPGTGPEPEYEDQVPTELATELSDDASGTPPASEFPDSFVSGDLVPVVSFRPGSSREPAQGGLERHPLSRCFGDRDPTSLGRLRAAMRLQMISTETNGLSNPLDVELLEGQVLWDWDEYAIACEIGLPLRYKEFDGGDPVAYVCLRGLHGRQWSQSHKGVIVVSLCQWAPRGRPKRKKSTTCVDFSGDPPRCRTTAEMAALAGVGTTTISMARLVCGFGLAERVLAGDLTFSDAYKKARVVRDFGLEDLVHSGAASFDHAYALALPESAASGDEKNHDQTPSRVAMLSQVRHLERTNAELLEEIRLLRVENEEQRLAAAAADEALKRERKRADIAEAEIQILRQQLDKSRMEIGRAG